MHWEIECKHATLNNITLCGVRQEIIHSKNFLFVFKLKNNVNYIFYWMENLYTPDFHGRQYSIC